MTPIRACLLTASLAAAGLAQAQTPPPAPAPATKAEDSSLTWKGITLYGIVDIGIQNDTHSAPFSDYFPVGSGSLVQKNDYDSPTGITPSNLSQSRVGISGNEPIGGDWAGIFRFETFFNPQSGDISDACKSVALNNGKALTAQNVGVDSSICGQLFSGAAYAGFSSPTYGSFTFGRNVTLLADGIGKYDPLGASNAFSLIGFSGTAAGGGDTEDRRLDQSIKYYAKYDWLHLGALYQFGSQSGSINTGYQFQIGADYAGFSIDGYYFKKYDAIGVGSLSAAQVTTLQTGTCTAAAPATPVCWPISNSLSGTISDNQTYSVMASYAIPSSTFKLFGGYEHITFDNPSNPLPAGTLTIGGYILAFTNNAAYNNQKVLDVYWGGVKWGVMRDLDLLAAYYGYKQDSYAAVSCSNTSSGACSGTETVMSLVLDYRLTKRFDVYGGTMYSGVQDGLANGYLYHTNIATTAGLRFKF
ncbi:MAG TPA: porin [Steroidobacteraceae bacterium]|nr:porin [Steroidobacteraceae bacterium]